MRYTIVGVVLGASILRAATGTACSPPRYTYSTGDFGPQASDVALNAPLLVSITEKRGLADVDQDIDPVLELTAMGSDTKVVLRPTYLNHASELLAFVPQTRLLPNTTYAASFRLDAKASEPAASEMAAWQLTTGEVTRSALELQGDLKVTFEAGLDPRYECEEAVLGACTVACPEVGKDAVTKARIVLPTVKGGFAEEYLAGSISIFSTASIGDDGTLHTAAVPDLKAGEPGELVVTMPLVDGKAYTPCFTFEVSDARRDSLRSLPVCLNEAFPEPAKAKPEPKPMPMPGEPPIFDLRVDDEVDPEGSTSTSSGCNMSGQPQGAGSVLAVLLGLSVLTRRRKPRSAP